MIRRGKANPDPDPMTAALTPTSPPIGVMSPLVGLLPPDLANLEKDVFFWEFDQLPVPALGRISIKQLLTTEKHLLVFGGMAQVTDSPADAVLVPFYPALVTLKDGTNRELMNADVPFSSLFGTGQLPAIWPWRKFIPAGSTLQILGTSLDAADRRVRITLLAIAVYT